jgi:cobalt transporter subunit CbtA
MFVRILLTALIAGVLAGMFIFAAHMAQTSPLILHAEIYENAGSSDAHGSTTPSTEATSEAEEWGPTDGIERSAYTLLADMLTSIGFAFVLVGAIALSGRDVDWHRGMIWGLCGFAVFFAGPSLGLAPELPGMQAADLQARQIWWISTVVLTAGGLAILFFANLKMVKLAGLLLIITPHLIGAPAHEIHPGGVPAELAAEFVAATLVISGLFWLLLGGLTGHFYRRFAS